MSPSTFRLKIPGDGFLVPSVLYLLYGAVFQDSLDKAIKFRLIVTRKNHWRRLRCSIHYTSGSRAEVMHGPRAQVFIEENSGLPWNLASLFPSLKKTFAVSTTRADPDASAEVIHGPKARVFTEENSGLPWDLPCDAM